MIVEKEAKIGEKITLSHYYPIKAVATYAYVHPGNRMASVVGLSKTGYDEEGKEMSMQVIAGRPVALNKESVPAEIIEREMEVYRGQVREEGKPEDMVEKIEQILQRKHFVKPRIHSRSKSKCRRTLEKDRQRFDYYCFPKSRIRRITNQ